MFARKTAANAIRALSMDSIQKAGSGHPGAPMGMADIAEVLWCDYLNHNPSNPDWINRDRFVLSNGHGSMLLYSLLHLTGYDVSIADLQSFRQLHSKTPGHPEYKYTPGVETTTGPLGQGLANAVGMAIAEKMLASQFNRPGYDIVDHYTYVFMGDGCLMEGISHEVCSLAGTLKLGKLIAFYDDNGISIDGDVGGWFTDNTVKRFEAYGWHVISNINGHNSEEIKDAIEQARYVNDRPSIIICKTVIGYGAPNKAGSSEVHGAPLGEAEVAATRESLGWLYEPFTIPDDIYSYWDARSIGKIKEGFWNEKLKSYEALFPKLAAEFKRRNSNELPVDWSKNIRLYIEALNDSPASIATRKASQNVIEFLGKQLPELIGGSADLAPSNLTMWSGSCALNKDGVGNYIHYGVRELGMTAIINGIALHRGFIAYGATFLMFMEYARNALRMSALMHIRNIQVYTHDSIGVGEDGPTHQPIEQLANLRTTPHMQTWRPCDQVETAVAWKSAIERHDGPSALVLSRQALPQIPRCMEQLLNISRGGYILQDSIGKPDLIIIATGSEVSLAVAAANALAMEEYQVRVVSMPSTEIFDKQNIEYRASVLLPDVTTRIAIEAGIANFWCKYVGPDGTIIGMTDFGLSAPADVLFSEFGFTVENVLSKARHLLSH
ncbi:transketolase [Aeromonas veronii]|uniref:transketolase n=1 Tax=Aeromonas veronii TaxID=654 RepID=UPI0011165420|nr:transketolase [Aeromonas veronii]TNI01474.1 transketolase [Aeromonas veronii]HDO1310173.1 transketolase [Aeromonas veronii]HDO1317769.1 transketolase [Aeromonas veronii]HDO1331668.1 transketolase [Aeromonas veronii]HDO1336311.1 transketolase [Aeromonas veronii]